MVHIPLQAAPPDSANESLLAGAESRTLPDKAPALHPLSERLSSYLPSVTRQSLQIGLLLFVFLLLYAPAMRALATTWWDHNRLEQFVIPLLSLSLVWTKREELERLPVQPATFWGLPLVLLAALLLLLGEVGAIITLSQISLILMIAGLILTLLGTTFLRRLSVPLAFLFLMLPLLEDIVGPLNYPLQLLTAQQGVAILQALGYPALVDRTFIVLPHITLEVARVCSGVIYLISILSIGIPLAYVSLKTWKGRALLVLSALMIGVASNWVRVVLIGIWTSFDRTIVHGPFHIFQGMFVAWVAYVCLFIGARSLAKLEQFLSLRRSAMDDRLPANGPRGVRNPSLGTTTGALLTIGKAATGGPQFDSRAVSHRRFPWSSWNRAWWTALLTLAGLLAYLSLPDPPAVALGQDLADFPSNISGWSREAGRLHRAEVRLEGADAELFRTYQTHQARIHVYVAYFASQKHGKKAVSYLTDTLHQNARQIDIRIDSHRTVTINETLSTAGQGNRRLLFWYDVNGRIIANRYRAKLATLIDTIASGRRSGAFVLLTVDAPHGEDLTPPPDAYAFVQELIQILQRHLVQAGLAPVVPKPRSITAGALP